MLGHVIGPNMQTAGGSLSVPPLFFYFMQQAVVHTPPHLRALRALFIILLAVVVVKYIEQHRKQNEGLDE